MENIEQTIEAFRKAVLEANTGKLYELLSDELSYGHSDGHVEGKADFTTKIGDGRYQFLTMELTGQTIIHSGDTAIVRHELDAKTNDEEKPGEAHLHVLLIWKKSNTNWQLIARQAVKKQH